MLKEPEKQMVVITKDLSEQPAASLMIAHDGECLRIDDFEVNEVYVTGYRNTTAGRVVVTAFPTRDTWMVYQQDYMDVVPRDSLNKRQLEAAKYNAGLLRQLALIKRKEGETGDDETHGVYL